MQVQVINKQIREHSIENIINKRDRKKDKKPKKFKQKMAYYKVFGRKQRFIN